MGTKVKILIFSYIRRGWVGLGEDFRAFYQGSLFLEIKWFFFDRRHFFKIKILFLKDGVDFLIKTTFLSIVVTFSVEMTFLISVTLFLISKVPFFFRRLFPKIKTTFSITFFTFSLNLKIRYFLLAAPLLFADHF